MGESPDASGGAPDEVVLAYRLEERIPLGALARYRHVERWEVTVLLDRHSSAERPAEIGSAGVLVFNLEPDVDIGDLVDHASGTWVDVDTASVVPRLAEQADGHLLLLDRVWLHPDHRGHGLGPIVGAAVIARLGRGCRLAACYPAPFDDTARRAEDRERAVEALGRVWSQVGFRHWRDGVWMLDLAASDVHSTLVELLATRSLSESGA